MDRFLDFYSLNFHIFALLLKRASCIFQELPHRTLLQGLTYTQGSASMPTIAVDKAALFAALGQE